MRIRLYIYPDVAGSNVHVITVIEYVDKQEIHMTAKEMECLDEIAGWHIFFTDLVLDCYTWKFNFIDLKAV